MNHLETSYTTHDGIKLFLQAWMPEKPIASLLLVHGLGDHSSRYAHFAERLVGKGIAVFTFDGRGHGKSATPPTAYFENYEDYLRDIDALFGKVKAYVPQAPTFLFGHSMGGSLVASYVIHYQPKAEGVILASAALKPGEDISKLLIAASSIISKLAPRLKVLQLDSNLISRDPEEVRKYREDPLVYTNAIPARSGYENLRMIRMLQVRAQEFLLPVLIMHGSKDGLTNPTGSEEFYRAINSRDKTYLPYPGLYHELLNEYEKDEVMDRIIEWIGERLKI